MALEVIRAITREGHYYKVGDIVEFNDQGREDSVRRTFPKNFVTVTTPAAKPKPAVRKKTPRKTTKK